MARHDSPPATRDTRRGSALSVVARINRLATQRVRLPLPYAQARLLSTIEDQGAARISDLAALDHCSQPTMTTQVRRLEDAGLVSRTADPADARAVLISITPKGVDTLARSAPTAARPSIRISSGSTTPTGRRSPTPSSCCAACSTTRAARQSPPPTNRSRSSRRMWRQPKAVWAVAFASVVAFMGIGLVDPILKPIADNLDASPSQVSLLFTSYMAVMGVAMLITGVVSSRIGPKRTLLIGLVIIIAGAGLAGLSDTVMEIVGWRALWGLGNALFIATALATIVNSARGSVAQAIILYEAALGLGIAVGPLVGGVLGVDLLARTVLRGLGADGRRAGRHRVPAARRRRAPHTPPRWPTRSGRCGTAACSASRSPRCCTTSASSPCWRSRRSRSTWAPTRSG